jgi:hypothetical protein
VASSPGTAHINHTGKKKWRSRPKMVVSFLQKMVVKWQKVEIICHLQKAYLLHCAQIYSLGQGKKGVWVVNGKFLHYEQRKQ